MSIYGVMLGSGAENPTYAVSPNVSSVNEGSSVTWNITTTNVPNSTTLYWTNNGTTGAADFTGGANSGSFTITNNVGSFSLTLVNDVTTEGSETIIIQIRTGSISGPVVATASTVTVNDTSLAPTYSVSPNTSTVNEGSGVTWTVTTANVSNGTVLYWTNGGTTVAGDFSENVNSGSVTINSNTGAFALNLVNDATTEGSETIVISIRTGSTSGPVVATAATVTVNDTSLTPTYSVSPTTTSVNEGSSVTFNVSTANVGNGTTLYWTNAGTTVAGDFSDSANSGSFTINTNSGSVTKTLNNDVTTEGSETIIFQVRTGSTGGPVVATAATVTVNDTSLTPTYSVSGSPNPQSEGGTITWSVTTTNVANGTTLYYTFTGSAGTSDYTSASSGSFTINSNAGSFTTTLANDSLTEGSETIAAQIRTGSTGGPVVATASAVTISDTSLSRGYSAIVYPGITNANTPRPEGTGAVPNNLISLSVNNATPTDCFRFGIHTGNTANSDWQVTNLSWFGPGGPICQCSVFPGTPPNTHICGPSNMPFTFCWVPGATSVNIAGYAILDRLQPGPEGTEWTHFDIQATGGCNNSHQCIFTAANFPILDNCWYSTQPIGFNERILGGGAGGGGSTAQINPGPGGGGAGGWREVPAITFPTTACWGVTVGGGGGGGLNTGQGGAGGTTSALGFGTPAPGGGGGGASTGGTATGAAGGGGGGGGANCALGGLGSGGPANGGGGSGGSGRYANFTGSRGSMGGGGGGSLQSGQASWSTGTPVPAAGCGRGGNGGAGRLAYVVSGGNWQTDAGGGGGGGSGSDWTNHGSGGPGGGGDGWSGGGGNYAAAGGGGARGNGGGGVQGVGAIAHGGFKNTNWFSLNVAPSHHTWQHAVNCYMHQFDAPFCFTNNLYPDRLA